LFGRQVRGKFRKIVELDKRAEKAGKSTEDGGQGRGKQQSGKLGVALVQGSVLFGWHDQNWSKVIVVSRRFSSKFRDRFEEVSSFLQGALSIFELADVSKRSHFRAQRRQAQMQCGPPAGLWTTIGLFAVIIRVLVVYVRIYLIGVAVSIGILGQGDFHG
jgi:hypothetical protein